MSTAALGEIYPSKMNSFPRRPSSTTSMGSTTDYQPYSSTTMEDSSGNLNNRGMQRSTLAETTTRDSSTTANTGGATLLQRSNSNLSNAAPTSRSFTAATDEESIIEEKRKRANGDGYSIHRYRRGRLLGKGGFAKVYLCTAMDTGKNYAVKVVPKANLVKARARQKLQAEIKIHRNLKHKHVCQYKHYFEDRNNCYILLELCHNQSLNEMIKRRKRLTEPEAAFFMHHLLEATRYMHEQNVIHRDLKLGNLFLDKEMNIKVGDLGLATRVEDKDEKRKTICGTPNYIAPEIIQGDKAKRGHSFEVDVWSMGVILYTIIIGKPPYEAKDVKATYQRILNNEYSFPRHVDISNSAKSLIKSMLQSKPSDRPSLDEIEAHPFLVESHIPVYLPSSVLSIAPVWRVNEHGELVCNDSSKMSKKPASLPRASRQPFSSRDPNLHKTSTATTTSSSASRKEGRDVINMERVVKTAVANMASAAQRKPSPAFTILDESKKDAPRSLSNAKPSASVDVALRDEAPGTTAYESRSARMPPPQQSNLTEEVLVSQTRGLSIKDPAPRHSSAASSVFTHATSSMLTNSENDADILQNMADHLDTVISVTESRKGSYRSASPRPLSARYGASTWVTRYVDYTSKYGLGFLLNNGSSGVYFNDSTKTALEANGDTFQYIERKKVEEEGTSRRRGETTVETHDLETYPDYLKKKVTLLKHFRNYLIEQQKSEGDSAVSDARASPDLVYVKKWVRTKHAILFALSNRTVQVIFYDQTEILLTPDVAFLTYVDKQRSRSTYDFTDELVGSSAEIEKRLKYSAEIFRQLLSGQRN